MGLPTPPTPTNPTSAEDRAWRTNLETPRGVDEATNGADYTVQTYRERRQYDADGHTIGEPVRENIPATAADGGKPPFVDFSMVALMGDVGKGRDITIPATPYGPALTFKLAQIGLIIQEALNSVCEDNRENRKLYQQLLAGTIDQAQYDAAVALLVATSPIE